MNYEKLEIEISYIDEADVITTSTTTDPVDPEFDDIPDITPGHDEVKVLP